MAKTLTPAPKQQWIDESGDPIALGKVWTYAAGTTTPLATYTSSTGSAENANPVVLDSSGRAGIWLSDSYYKFVVTDADDNLVYTVDNISPPASAAALAASGGSSLIGFIASGIAAVARTVLSKLRDRIDARDYGVTGDGSDEYAKLQAALAAAAGKRLYIDGGLTITVGTGLTVGSNTTIEGKGAIKAKTNSSITNLLDCTGSSGVVVSGIEIDANADNTGANNGIVFSGGSRNSVINCYVHDTQDAGVRAASESNFLIWGGSLINCGRTGTTDNHAFMFYSTSATPAKNGRAVGVYIENAYRKGLGVYSDTVGFVDGFEAIGCTVVNCGLGGFYAANAATANNLLSGVKVTGGRYAGNYGNILIANATGAAINGATCTLSTRQNIYLDTITNSVISGNTCLYANQENVAAVAGILLKDSTYNLVDGNSVIGEGVSPKQTDGITETGTSDYNTITKTNKIENVNGGSAVVFVGSHSRTCSPGGRTMLTISAGANNDVALPGGDNTFVIDTLAGVANITGFVKTSDIDEFWLINFSGQVVTLTYDSSGSLAGNRIAAAGNADLVMQNAQSAHVKWIPNTGGHWFAQ